LGDYWQFRAGEPSVVSAVLARLAASTEQAAERLAEHTIVEQVTAPVAGPAPDAGPLLITSSSEFHGSVPCDTIVQRNCTLHVRGNLLGSLTIEPGANVVVEGSVDGKITNLGGWLLVHNKGLAACVALEGPPEAEAAGILKVNLTNLAANFERLSKRTDAECAAVVKADAYGCGIGPIAGALSKSGCNTFFVSDLAQAKRVRTVAPRAVIYLLGGFYSGTGPAFAEIDARPVINSAIELAEWDMFVASQASSRGWAGGCALNVDSGAGGLGLSVEEAAAFAPRVQSLNHGIALLLSRLDKPGGTDDPAHERRLGVFRDLRRLYGGVPASLATSSGIFAGIKAHFDLVRAGSALYGVNPTPGAVNPMLPVVELAARIVQVREFAPGQTLPAQMPAGKGGAVAKRRMRVAFVSLGYADGYPRPAAGSAKRLHVMIRGHRCPVLAPPTMELLPIDVTDLPDRNAARFGALVTLIGDGIGLDELAGASGMAGREILARLGRRFHRVYYAT
jgi:alanine racemase